MVHNIRRPSLNHNSPRSAGTCSEVCSHAVVRTTWSHTYLHICRLLPLHFVMIISQDLACPMTRSAFITLHEYLTCSLSRLTSWYTHAHHHTTWTAEAPLHISQYLQHHCLCLPVAPIHVLLMDSFQTHTHTPPAKPPNHAQWDPGELYYLILGDQ